MTTAQITRTAETDPTSGTAMTVWAISDTTGDNIAELKVETATGEILWIWTHEDHRDNGHATALYRLAATEITIYHAPEGHRTDDGDRFAARVGGPAITCTTCCAGLDDTDDYYAED